MKPEEVLPEIPDNSIVAFRKEPFLIEKLRWAIASALDNFPSQYTEYLREQGLNLETGIPRDKGEAVNSYYSRAAKIWINEGIDCALLQPGSPGWRKGKLKITVSVDFIEELPEPDPNEADRPEPSLLDAIRQTPDTINP